MRLQRLTALEADKVRAEHADLMERIGELRAILGDEAKVMGLVKDELADRLGDWMATVSDPLLRGPIPAPDLMRTGSGSVWAKAPTHEPSEGEFRWDILRTQAFGEEPLELERE